MAVLEQLGINQTVFIQFFIFLIAFVALSQLVFTPYAKAFEHREEKTKGGEELAIELQRQSVELISKYEIRARQVSGEIKTIFDSYRDQANKECEAIVSKARAESQKIIEEARARMVVESTEAAEKLRSELPKISAAITAKLLAK